MNRKREVGKVILILPLIILITGSAFALLGYTLQSAVMVRKTEHVRMAARETANASISLANLGPGPALRQQRVLCTPIIQRFGDSAASRSICTLQPSAEVLQPSNTFKVLGLRDFNAVFKAAAKCSQTTSPSPQWLSPYSYRSAFSCFPAAQVRKDAIYQGNLKIKSPLNFSAPLLAATGYVWIANQLLVASDLEILAGGDILIDSIVATGSTVTVTTISATGEINVGNLVGVELLAEARSKVTAPHYASPKPSKKLAPLTFLPLFMR